MLDDRYHLAETLQTSRGRRLVRARDTRLQREVFVLLPPAGGARASSDELREARSLARVRHPGLASLLEVVDGPDGAALVLEPFAGEPLRERVERDGPLGPTALRSLGRRAAEALGALHAQGLVHRGVSEESLFVDEAGGVVLLGFELAKDRDLRGLTSLNVPDSQRAGRLDEIPVYPAPEQWAGHAADERSDLFALGCTLRFALTGERVSTSQPVPEVRCADAALGAVVDRLTSRLPTRRYAGTFELLEALGAEAPTSSAGRRRGLAAAALGGAALVVGGLLLGPGSEPDAGTVERGLGLPGGVGAGPARAAEEGRYAPTYAASRALLIGIDYAAADSPWAAFELANAEGDVHAIRDGLLELGWRPEDVIELTGASATRDGIEQALRVLEQSVEPDDQVLIYYAGHGVRHPNSDESGWAIPADAGLPPESGGEGERWLHFDRFDRVFREYRAKHILVALDCCHGGAGMSRLRGGASAVSESRIGAYLSEPARLMIASSRPNEVALDGIGEHSPFASGFLSALADARERYVPARGLLSRIQGELLDGFGDRQRPLLMAHPTSSPGAEFFFLRREP